MIRRFRVVPAAYVLLLRDVPDGGTDATRPEVLLQMRSGTGFMDDHWAIGAAGHVEDGEPAPIAALREAREEVGVEIDPADLHPLTVVHRTRRTGNPLDERADFFFTCRRWHGEPRRMEPDRSADLRWFALDALPEPVVPHELMVLEALRAGTVPPILVHGFPDGG